MKILGVFMLVCLCCFGGVHAHNRPKNQVDPLQDIIDKEADQVFKIVGLSCKVQINNSQNNSSLYQQGIFLSHMGLVKYQQKYKGQMFKYVIDYLLAHEISHQLQFGAYKNEILQNASCEKQSMYECQADLVAGILMAKLYNYKDTVNYTVKTDQLVNNAFTFLYEIGDEEYTISMHPSHTQRRNAIRLGMAYSMVNGNWSPVFNQHLIKAIDYYNGRSMLDWSLNTAKRIMHYPIMVGKDITLISLYNDDTALVWDTTSKHPYVSFSKTFNNRANKPVRIFAQFKLLGKRRDDLYNNKLVDMQGDVANFSFVLKPNESYKCSGTLNWANVGNNRFEPAFISPPDNESLYNAEYVDASLPVGLDGYCEDRNYLSDAPQIAYLSDEAIRSALQRVNGASIEGFNEFRTGFAHQSLSGTYTYYSSYKFPLSKSISISENHYNVKNRPAYTTNSMFINFYADTNTVDAKRIFNKFALLLNHTSNIKIKDDLIVEAADNTATDQYKVLPNNVLSRNSIDGKYRSYTMVVEGEFQDTHTKFSLDYNDDERYDNITVKLTIRPQKTNVK